ncbi:hypothetical protein MSIMFI_04268 [Mycobacterium simulans]|uniref:hypothetical protein n=1 Tax=Mycobacterium simulans TaxID=627089 RepID=UPI0017483977|nr:hypothetical protein [Mycobacterium simulans]SON62740.1 hypothetical protein MSIMFI_04268 [Mycobacterium simulans]
MSPSDVERYMGSMLANLGFDLDEVDPDSVYDDRPAWAVFYRSSTCKLQVCWSARDSGIDFMLAPLDAPNEFGLLNRSKKWRFMLMLSDTHDGLTTPGLDADDDTVMSWLRALFEIHFEAARCAVVGS